MSRWGQGKKKWNRWYARTNITSRVNDVFFSLRLNHCLECIREKKYRERDTKSRLKEKSTSIRILVKSTSPHSHYVFAKHDAAIWKSATVHNEICTYMCVLVGLLFCLLENLIEIVKQINEKME